MEELSEHQKSIIEFLSSDKTVVEYERTFRKGENVYVNIYDPEDPDNAYFYVVTCDEFNVRAVYKLPDMEDENTIVIDLKNREDDRCDLYIRSLDFTLSIRS